MTVPIRVRMTLWYAALLALIIAALGAFLVLRLRTDLTNALDGRLRPALDQIALGYQAEGTLEARDVSATVLSETAAASQVLMPDGRVVVSFGGRKAARPLLSVADIRSVIAGGRFTRTQPVSGQPFRVIARSTTRAGAPRVVVAAESTASIDNSVQRLLALLLLACPVALVLTAAGGWWLASRALSPIDRLTGQARQIGIDRLSDRLPAPSTGDEVARLAATLNTMLARIETGVEEQRRIVADTSHELRSPLAAMRAELDVSLLADDLQPEARAVLRGVGEEVDRLRRIVDGLLTLARADQGTLGLLLRPLDLADVAGEAVDRVRALADSRRVTLDATLDSAPAEGDPIRLGQAIANLLDNAIEFSPAGGTVTVAVASEGEQAVVRILDEGPGVPDGARERIFDRFHRLDASRARSTGGSGIGLSIVRELARAHGGRVWHEPGPQGGSTFVLAVPAALRSLSTTPE